MAYYSDQGEKIFSGAAGLGAYGPLRSYRDGSLGNYGKLAAFKDGSLGHHNSQLEAFQDGSLGVMATMISRPMKHHQPQQSWTPNVAYEVDPEYVVIPTPKRPELRRVSSIYSTYNHKRNPVRSYGPVRGTTMAIDNGVLGGYGPLQSFQDGSLGGYGLLQAYEDGSLGADNPSGIGEYFTGTAGVGEYFTGMAGCGSCGGGLGQAASGVVLNLSDPATLQEVKSLIAYSPLMVGNVGLPETQADLASSKWTAHTTALVNQLLQLSAMQLQAQWAADPSTLPKKADGTAMSVEEATADLVADFAAAFPEPERYPTYDGIMLLRALLGTAPVNVPIVDAYIKAGGGPVSAPNKAQQANMVGIGVGVAVVALLGALFFTGKKRA